MTGAPLRTIAQQLHHLAGHATGPSTDAQLLDAYVGAGDQSAFEALVRRHGGMVFALCRRLLGHRHDAEDAYQAAFLVFARKAGSIGKGQSVGSWLYKAGLLSQRRAVGRPAGAPEFHGRGRARLRGRQGGGGAGRGAGRLPGVERRVFDVGLDGAKPTAGYLVRVWLGEGGKAAARVVFQGAAGERGTPPDLTGLVTAVGKDGKALTLGPVRGGRGEEGKKHEVQLTDKTALVFHGVALGGAKVAEGMVARVWLVEGSKDTVHAAEIYGPQASGRRETLPTTEGKVTAVSKDGKSFTLEGPPRARGEEVKKTDVVLSDKATLAFRNVAPGGAKVVEGMFARVWVEEGAKGRATHADFTGLVKEREERVGGKVVAVGKDGKSITLEHPSRERGEGPVRVEIKWIERTRVAFSNIGPGEAKLAEGLFAFVVLKEGTRDTASVVHFRKGGSERGR